MYLHGTNLKYNQQLYPLKCYYIKNLFAEILLKRFCDVH